MFRAVRRRACSGWTAVTGLFAVHCVPWGRDGPHTGLRGLDSTRQMEQWPWPVQGQVQGAECGGERGHHVWGQLHGGPGRGMHRWTAAMRQSGPQLGRELQPPLTSDLSLRQGRSLPCVLRTRHW